MASYLDIYSTYRNRNIWPNPGEFEVLVSISGRKSAMNADDPVALASPLVAWTSSLFNATALGANNVQGAISNVGVGNATSNQIITFTSAAGALQESTDYYRGATWRNITDPTQYAKVTSYKYLGSDRGQVTLDNAVVVTAGDTFDILDSTDLTDTSNPLFFVPMGADEPSAYIGFLLYNETLNQFRTIDSYNNTTGLLTVDAATPVAGWLPTHNYSIRKQPPVLVSLAAAGSTSTQIVFGAGAGMVDNLYNGWFVRTLRTVYDNNPVPPQGEQRRIIAYDGGTLTATVSPAFTASTLGSTVELLQFSYENMYPFPFRATLQQEIPTYSIRLNRLVLPNKVLKVHGGGKTAFHNYVYVELASIDNPNNSIIFSNNPNAVRALFTASVTNIDDIDQSDYIVMDGDDMTQTVRFRLDTNFKFRVSMPNGETFETVLNDNLSPLEPNPKVQIRALFQLVPIVFEV
jgi:hypothetical protein